MSTFNLEAWSTPKRAQLQQTLLNAFAEESSAMHTACQYPIETGGKRIRPLFLFAGLEALEHEISNDAYLAGAALELIHTYSLVHDDLPCMDDDDERRGKPTVHKVYNDGVAVLVGDALLTKAFELLANTDSAYAAQLVLVLSRAAGAMGMIGGQSLDIGFEGPVTDIKTLTRLHRRKTGALIQVGLTMAAIIAQATGVQRQSLEVFGRHIGFAFQLADDLLDAEEDAAEDGPPSFVKLLGEDETSNKAKHAMKSALAAIEDFTHTQALVELAHFTVQRQF
jgi:farnesyl diphosphate synthase